MYGDKGQIGWGGEIEKKQEKGYTKNGLVRILGTTKKGNTRRGLENGEGVQSGGEKIKSLKP